MTAGWIVTGLGVIVSLIGWYLTPGAWGYGIFGFGLAHIVLGLWRFSAILPCSVRT